MNKIIPFTEAKASFSQKSLDNKNDEDYSALSTPSIDRISSPRESEKIEGVVEIKKPEAETSSSTENRIFDGDTPNIHFPKDLSNGKCMSYIGFFKVPRSIYSNSLFTSLTIKAQSLFIRLLSLVCYKPQKFDAHGNIIDLEPGQYGTTFRELAEIMGKEYDKDVIARALHSLQVRQLVRQETRHKKTIITITLQEFYVQDISLSATTSATTSATILRQSCDIKEERKKDKKEKNRDPLPPKIFFRSCVSLTQEEFDKLEKLWSKESLDKRMDVLDSYKASNNKTYASDYHVLNEHGWVAKRLKDDEEKAKSPAKTYFSNKIDRTQRNKDGTVANPDHLDLF